MSNGGVDRVLGNVTLQSEVVVVSGVFGQFPALFFHFVR